MSRISKWPAGALERELAAKRKSQLREARKSAEKVRVGRRVFRLVRLPDSFDQRPREPEVIYHRTQVQVMRDAEDVRRLG